MRKNIFEEEKIPSYKPFSKRSKFLKPNKWGQVAKDCIHLQYCKSNKKCWIDGDYETNAKECLVLKGEYCEKYNN